MNETTPSALLAWESFYVIVGSTAGALTGLQFVVLTLVAESGRVRTRGETMSAFGSPNVVHFCAALLVAAILSVPWGGLAPVGVILAVLGGLGVIYAVIVVRRTMRQSTYVPVLEDWIWHGALPMLAYASLVYAGLSLRGGAAGTLYVVGAAVLLLVFIGVHNAWDTVMYLLTMEEREAAATAVTSSTHVPGRRRRRRSARP